MIILNDEFHQEGGIFIVKQKNTNTAIHISQKKNLLFYLLIKTKFIIAKRIIICKTDKEKMKKYDNFLNLFQKKNANIKFIIKTNPLTKIK
jgi:hypothetical protein